MDFQRKMLMLFSFFIIFFILMACLAHTTRNTAREFEQACHSMSGYLTQDNCVVRQISSQGSTVESRVCETVCKHSQTQIVILRQNN